MLRPGVDAELRGVVHELSLATEACRMARDRLALEVAAAPAGVRLVELGLEVGDDAGVEVESLRFCMEALLATPPFGGARVVLVRVPGDVLRLSYLEIDDGGADD